MACAVTCRRGTTVSRYNHTRDTGVRFSTCKFVGKAPFCPKHLAQKIIICLFCMPFQFAEACSQLIKLEMPDINCMCLQLLGQINLVACFCFLNQDKTTITFKFLHDLTWIFLFQKIINLLKRFLYKKQVNKSQQLPTSILYNVI